MIPTPKLQFWTWLFVGVDNTKPGLRTFWNKWLMLHCCVALFCFWQNIGSLSNIAKAAILPFAGAFLGMTFAWSGNITSLLATEQLSELSDYVEGGISTHIYTVQLSILTVFLTSIFWTLAAIGIISSNYWSLMLYFLSSIAVRECWQMILFAQYMTICRDHLSRQKREKK